MLRFMAYPIFWLIDAWWLLVDGYTRRNSSTPWTKEMIADLRRMYPDDADEILAKEKQRMGRHFSAGAVRMRRLAVIVPVYLIITVALWRWRHN